MARAVSVPVRVISVFRDTAYSEEKPFSLSAAVHLETAVIERSSISKASGFTADHLGLQTINHYCVTKRQGFMKSSTFYTLPHNQFGCSIIRSRFLNKNLLAIEQALLPDGKIILESTANGMNEFSNIWGKAENHENLYKPFFFGWIDDKVMFAQEYKQFAERYVEIHGEPLTYEQLEPEERE